MLEPLAATVLNSLLSARPLKVSSLPSQPALRMVARTAGLNLPHDFFTPHPRRVKGKERALPQDECDSCSSNNGVDHNWVSNSCRGTWRRVLAARKFPHGSFCAPDKRHLAVVRDVAASRQRTRRVSGQRCLHTAGRNHIPSPRTWMRHADPSQRRHASSFQDPPDTPRPDEPPDPSRPEEPPHVTQVHLSAHQKQEWARTIVAVGSHSSAFDLRKAWGAYESLQKCGGCASLATDQLLAFASRVVAAAAGKPHEAKTLDALHSWGIRIQELLHQIDPGIADDPRDFTQFRWRCLEVCSFALMGSMGDVMDQARELLEVKHEARYRVEAVKMYTVIALTVRQYSRPANVLEFVMTQWEALNIYLHRNPEKIWRDQTLINAANTFRKVIREIVTYVDKPVAFMVDVHERWTEERRQWTGHFLVRVLSDAELSLDALRVLERMQRERLYVPAKLQLAVVKSLARTGSYELANTLFHSLPQAADADVLFRDYQSVGLFLYSHQGDVANAEAHYDRLAERGWVDRSDVNMLLHVHAIVGRPARVVELFNHFFPSPTKELPQDKRPTIVHYTTIIFAHAQAGDLEGMNAWLANMTESGLQPDLYVYSIILQSFAMRGQTDSMAALLDQMRAASIKPTRVVYTTVIALLARRRDPVAAELMFKRALKEGIIPDRRMITALMNAHVEAGSWKGVIRAFDYMHTSGARGIRLTIEVFNTLLKAYVLIGAPFRVVANLFQKLEGASVRPDAHTFALLIQSACDAGMMDIAVDLYNEMQRLALEGQSTLEMNTFTLTILMTGYLRKNDRVKAKGMLDEMKARGIQPSAVTFGAIIKAYGNDQSGAGLKVAEEFLQSLMASDPKQRPWLTSVGGRQLTLQHIFSPLMVAYAYKEKPVDVERLFQQLVDGGGEVTLGALTALLDVYRRTHNIDAVHDIWPRILQLGLRYSEANTLFEEESTRGTPNLRRQGVVMCVPLSIYIDALSSAGEHLHIAETWKALKDLGLSFDSHNWNHLSVALVRAGEPERAFSVVEDVILRYQRQSRQWSLARDETPDSPLLFDLPPKEEDVELDQEPETNPEAPLHSLKRRVAAVRMSSKRLPRDLEDSKPDDFAHPLHVMHQISPSWNVWRPHGATLTVLSEVLTHLSSGRLIQPVRPEYEGEFAETPADIEDLERRTREAGETLGRIYDNYPQTVRIIGEYNLMKRSREQRIAYRGP
ncbi:Protein Rf1, mitochondrial [Grifola frondosa]|uniref:Protein Rf1, mitochondrial n=1 Tax=Grifola frondosa TaxID=5627 RepID=A0A1C7MJE9_GRIFR|nr:Protein Rf1, mitochondrial [Grifola frondosa]